MIYPKFETLIKFNVPDKNIDISGDFRITYDFSKVNEEGYYIRTPGAAYVHGRRPIIRLENLLADNDKKLMLVYDSFSLPVIPFLALGVKNIQAVDLRQFTGSLETFTKKYKPDLMILIYYIEMLSDDGKGNYDPFNFR